MKFQVSLKPEAVSLIKAAWTRRGLTLERAEHYNSEEAQLVAPLLD